MEIVGNGTIQEVQKGKVYRIRHNLGKDPVTGKYRKSPWRTVHCSKRQARDELARYKQELIDEYEKSLHKPEKIVPTVGEYVQHYLETRSANKSLAKATEGRDRCDANHVIKLFGEFPMNELTAAEINSRCAAYRLAEAKSLNLINRIARFLKRVYKRAVAEGIIDYRDNPCFGIDIDKPEPSKRRSLTRSEYKRLNQTVMEQLPTAQLVALKLGISTGMRKGEVLGLEWGNVDLEHGKIRICQQYTQQKELKKPKSKTGIRVLSIDSETIHYLGDWRARQEMLLGLIGSKCGSRTPVVSNDEGTWLDPSCFTRWFQQYCVDHGFGRFEVLEEYRDNQGRANGWRRLRKAGYKGLCFHELRHTQATMLIASNCDIKTVQYRLGHSDVETTLNIYSHAIVENDLAAAEVIGALIA